VSALAGVRVLELGTGIGASFCTKLLGQLGAHVVKVTPPRPKPEAVTEEAALRERAEYVYLDAGKEAIECGLDTDAFLDEVHACDLLVHGLDPATGDAAAGLRAEYESLRRVKPDLIYVALTPFGTTGAQPRGRGAISTPRR